MIILVADEYNRRIDRDVLHLNMADGSWVGGAVQDNLAILERLRKDLDIKAINTRQLHRINPEYFYILGNFWFMKESVKRELEEYQNYIILEHDHKYVMGRNPFEFPGMMAPEDKKINLDLYKRAQAVFCRTKKHKEVIEKNIDANLLILGTSFYSKSEIDFIKNLIHNGPKKTGKAAIYRHAHPAKGMKQSIEFCQKRGIPFDLIINKPTRAQFLEQLARYNKLVFLANNPEAFSRIVAEAKMLGLDVVTTPIVGITGEDWYPLSGLELVDKMYNGVMKEAENKIRSFL